jgi:hypothetical protein
MSSIVQPRLHRSATTVARPATPAATQASTEPITQAETNRWLLLLVIPFVLGAAFFGLSIALDTGWPMAPAFLLGPLPLISAYIYLALTSDSNNE